MSRKCISLEEKIKILDRLKSGEKVIIIAKDLNLNEATIRTIKRNEDRIRATVRRFSLRNMKLGGETASADMEAAQRFREHLAKVIQEGNYTADQVYNADEFTLFWKKMPERTYLSRDEESVSGLKASKDRITLLLCSNASGDLVTKPMLINRSINPRAMKGIDKATLPVYWQADDKAWVTGVIFSDWFYNCFIPEVQDYSKRKGIDFKALLLINNAPGHPTNLSHPAVRVVFLPPNTTSILQPLDQGIIRTFKSYYIRYSFELILEKIGRRPNSETIAQIWKDFSILNCIEIISLSLKELKPSILNACWEKIWPEVVRVNCLASTTKMDHVMSVDRSLAEDVTELNNSDQDLDEEELIQLAEFDSTSTNQESSLEIPSVQDRHFSLKTLNEGLELARKLEEYFTNNDPSRNRSDEFKEKLRNCLVPYVELKRSLENRKNEFMERREDTRLKEENSRGEAGDSSIYEITEPRRKRRRSLSVYSSDSD
ncbi:PREDICTED: tigger transposable element-derived protein 1-like [Eufriesea mexicana]|uniref:tigger transposable element-derived protein 1-like n=1 Tax=Eufriesea mexicana TaxID=516756 RepID=UPI00083C7F58|nr:PREDICTED: tigger transposable element-derived protein 1-like [Eufriesea mexicana]